MKVSVVGGGPAGLYFALLLKKSDPTHDVTIIERNPAGATYGWGVVFSDRTLTSFREADFKTYEQITEHFIIWDAIDVRYRNQVVRCGGQVFSGIARKRLLRILQERCLELGVEMCFEQELRGLAEVAGSDLVVAADGVRSVVREAHAGAFRPRFGGGSSRYIWFGTDYTFDSFTFIFRSNENGFFQAHAYPFDGSMSTFIVECAEEVWRRAGLDDASEDETISYCERLFSEDLRGHRLRSNNSRWINFVTLKCKRWHHDNLVLVGDAAHTAHFSIGSGTKLAMEDSIALVNALETKPSLEAALDDYELERKPRVERFQEAARQSQTYFENTSRYQHMEPLQFAFHLLSRSGRIDYDNLRSRDPHFVGSVDRWFTHRGREGLAIAAPPAFAPLRLRALEISNRVLVTVPDGYDAVDGVPRQGGVERGARTGAGLVLRGHIAVSEHARLTLGCSGLYRTEHESAWSRELQRARDGTQAAFAASLSHSGPRGACEARVRAADVPVKHGGWGLLAASPLPYTRCSAVPDELDRKRMDDVLEDFAGAARRARAAGFDMAEVHMAHGCLLATFISPLTNKRSDGYGGSLENRLRYPLQVFDAVRAEWPDDMPVGVAMSASDWERGGLPLSEAVAVARILKEHGCDLVRVLAGQTTAGSRPRYDPYFLTRYADRIRNEAGIATVATGDISTVDHVNTVVAGGRADLCLLRP